jgi:Raf kinase inhibitor-like YbhB/YbcL family protein
MLMAEMALTSTAFEDREAIPRRHTCEGDDLSPPLAWTGRPPETQSLVLLVDDPDAPGGTFTHWLAWGIDPATSELSEGEAAPTEGRNDFGSDGYRGPCPPPGHGPHHYIFRLRALDAEIGVGSGADKAQVEQALADHVLAAAELRGTYER